MSMNPLGADGADAHLPRHYAQIGDQRLEYIDLPAHQLRRPPLIFLHEGLGSVSAWRDFPARVAAASGCRCLVYSRRGHGRSCAFGAPHTPRFVHEEALETLPALRSFWGVERPLLIGHSVGASMALLHAGAGRWELAGVAAMAPLLNVEESNRRSIAAVGAAYPGSGMQRRLARHHDDADAVFWSWNDTWLSPAFRDWNIEAELARLRCPVLAILGEDDEYSTPAQIAALQRAAAAAGQEIDALQLADCGHAPHRDQPEAVMTALLRLIDEATQ